MNLKGVDPRWLLYGAGVLAVGFIGWKLYRVATGAANVAGQALTAADDVIASGVGSVGAVVGLPTPAQTIDDPAQVRYIADRSGWFEASKWATAVALFRASSLAPGQGVPPPLSSPAARALGYDVVDEADRLAARYPAPPATIDLSWADPAPGLTQAEQFGLPM